jgi:hypothetical protein
MRDRHPRTTIRKRQQFAHVPFRVGQQVLVDMFVHEARKRLLPLPHGAVETRPVRRQILEAVRPTLPVGGHVLAVARKTRLDRITPAHDDLGTWQHRPNRADMQPVAGQLFGGKRPVPAPARRAFHVALAQPLPVIGRHRRDPLRIMTSTTPGFLDQHLRQVVQFARTFDRRMRGEDLLHEGGTGARQADDKEHAVPETGFGAARCH